MLRERYRIAKAFGRMFGQDAATRTEDQKEVLANLEQICCLKQTTAMQKPDGLIDPNMTLVLEGRRQLAIHINQMIEGSSQPPPTLTL